MSSGIAVGGSPRISPRVARRDASFGATVEGRGATLADGIGIVIIGRNVGERLRRCLTAVVGTGRHIVYADSGSTDGSLDAARAMGVETIALDPARPFSAARGRNEGLARLEALPGGAPTLVQFIDGDCELRPGWLEQAAAVLRNRPDLALVCGRLRERARNRSIYSRLCDMEWQRPVGPMEACGGIFMVRAEAFRQVGGFREQFVVGEEGDLCARLRRAGWRLERLDTEMATHDAAMTRFVEWWSRAVRGGYAYSLSAALGGAERSKSLLRQRWSGWVWGAVLPVLALALAWPTRGFSLLLLGVYPVQAARIAWGRRGPGETAGDRVLFGVACLASKWPQLLGQISFALERVRARGLRAPGPERGVSARGATRTAAGGDGSHVRHPTR